MMSDEKQAIHVIAEAMAKPGQAEMLNVLSDSRRNPSRSGSILGLH